MYTTISDEIGSERCEMTATELLELCKQCGFGSNEVRFGFLDGQSALILDCPMHDYDGTALAVLSSDLRDDQ